MSVIKPGAKCLIANMDPPDSITMPEFRKYLGTECIILRRLRSEEIIHNRHKHETFYHVTAFDGNEITVRYKMLQPIDPPKVELGSWDAMPFFNPKMLEKTTCH